MSLTNVARDIGNVTVLSTCQMLFGTGRGLFMITAPAVALLPGFAPHLALATLPAATVVVGTVTEEDTVTEADAIIGIAMVDLSADVMIAGRHGITAGRHETTSGRKRIVSLQY